MHTMQLSGLDTNLFLVLHSLLEEQNVARAGKRLGLSPSATSHALARLRTALGDPLFVKAGRNLVPTPHARSLQPALAQAIASLEAVVSPPRAVDLPKLERAFRVETTDHVQFVLLRQLDPIVREEAPRVNFYFQSMQPETFARLRQDAIDLAVGVYSNVDPDIERARLFDDRLVTVARKRHPCRRKPLTLRAFASYPHLLVAPNGTPTGLVDRVLAEHKLRRRVARTSATFLDMAFLVAESDYLVSLPESLTRPLLKTLGLSIVDAPVSLPAFTISMAWHRRQTNDSAHAWFREAVVRAAARVH
jgi:DNA-binding transcriptional LysR family regulator